MNPGNYAGKISFICNGYFRVQGFELNYAGKQMIMNDSNQNKFSTSPDISRYGEETKVSVPETNNSNLSPIDRVSEILFGVIMALTFTCTFEVANAGKTEIRDMLIGALGCNLVWGLVDGVFFILMGLTIKRRGLTILRFIKMNQEPAKARNFISDELPPVIASVLEPKELENIRLKIMNMEKMPDRVTISKHDLKAGGHIFLLVFLSTLPVAVPFIFMENARTALRISNLIAIIMMYICGWILGRYSSRNPWTAGLIMSGIGIVLVLLAIYLGG
jgi:hypothetical protein